MEIKSDILNGNMNNLFGEMECNLPKNRNNFFKSPSTFS